MSFSSDYGRNFRAPRVDVHQFSMIPRADIPRSTFVMEHQHKTTINAASLIPVYLQEILPGDTFNVQMTAFCRMATPIFPVMDNIYLESFFFFVPNRLVWLNWYKFMGEQDNPADSISFTIPQVVSPVGGFAQNSLYDYFGLPCVGQTLGGNTISVSALPFRAYNLIFHQWFRDQNLQNAPLVGSAGGVCSLVNMDNGPDPQTNYGVLQPNKWHDYFTAALPWTQKGGVAVTIPLGTSATVRTSASVLVSSAQATGANPIGYWTNAGLAPATTNTVMWQTIGGGGFGSSQIATTTTGATSSGAQVLPNNLYADLSTATAATINQLRLSFQTQKLLERDARGGTRYTEIIRSHFGVLSPDMRLQRPEYLGGGKTPINISPVPQTVPSTLSGTSNPPMGQLAGVGTGVQSHGWRQSFTEHGHVLGLVCVRRQPVYQQGIRRLWSRSTRYDFYFPVFAMLGEQSILNKEIYSDGSVNDPLVFGYIERWAEYRYHPSFTTGLFKSTNSTPIDAWHTAQKFTALPALNSTFIADDLFTTLQRNLALGSLANTQQFLCDFYFREHAARPMPMYSVPGLIDHF